ncbi:hypothetical protein [Sphaerospermopsis aphanizomenoides]|nr:hypothetical protein [Sphaerospermopsis aphanizomenoides]
MLFLIIYANDTSNIAEKNQVSISMAEKTKTRKIVDIILNNY